MASINVIAVEANLLSEAVIDVQADLDDGRAPTWQAIQFGKKADGETSDLLEKLDAFQASHIRKLEIVAEGGVFWLDGIDSHLGSAAADFATQLRDISGISDTTQVFLSGCNTGLSDAGTPRSHDIAQVIANGSRTTVFGARGYLSGAHATRNESCVPDYGTNGGALPGSRTAEGMKVWRACKPKSTAPVAAMAMTAAKLSASHSSGYAALTPEQLERIHVDVSTDYLMEAPRFRVSAERVIKTPKGRVFHVIANATHLRDAETYRIWPNSQGRALVSLDYSLATGTRTLA